MKCSQCQTDNPAGYNFCQECGNRLLHQVSCRSCGHKNLPDARFCNNCGMSLSAEAPPAQSAVRRTETSVANPQTPTVVYVRETPPQPKFNFLSMIWRFASSLMMGYLLSEVGRYIRNLY